LQVGLAVDQGVNGCGKCSIVTINQSSKTDAAAIAGTELDIGQVETVAMLICQLTGCGVALEDAVFH
jgi:hypothetical protein